MRRGQGDGHDALLSVRLGIYGGTFDPPHIGHLLTAGDAMETLSLDKVIFVPNHQQPLKGSAGASGKDRLAMLTLMLGGDARFAVDAIEVERKGLSFTVDTVEAFAERFPGAELFLLGGADVLDSFPQWRNTARILELATLVVLRRNRDATGSAAVPDGALLVQTRLIDISSTEIRARVGSRKSIHGFVVDPVAEFIRDRGLYEQVIA